MDLLSARAGDWLRTRSFNPVKCVERVSGGSELASPEAQEHGRKSTHACCVAYYRQILPHDQSEIVFAPTLQVRALTNIQQGGDCALLGW